MEAITRLVTDNIPGIILGLILSLIAFVLNQLLLRPWLRNYVNQRFEVDIRTENPVSIEFGSKVPSLSVWFRYTNKSLFVVQVDHLRLEIWAGQPIFQKAELQSMTKVSPGQTLGNNSALGFRFVRDLTSAQLELIKERLRADRIAAILTVDIHAHCRCWAGEFEVACPQRKSYLVTAVQGLNIDLTL